MARIYEVTLQESRIEQGGEWIVLTVDYSAVPLDPPADGVPAEDLSAYDVWIPPLALDSRMAIYDLKTKTAATEAILREHALRLSNLEPAGGDRLDHYGGRDERFRVDLAGWTPPASHECQRCGSDEWTYVDYGGCSECRP